MERHKNYEAIYNVFKGNSDTNLKKLYELYTGHEASSVKPAEGEDIDWTMQVVIAIAKSDGLTDEELDVVLDW